VSWSGNRETESRYKGKPIKCEILALIGFQVALHVLMKALKNTGE